MPDSPLAWLPIVAYLCIFLVELLLTPARFALAETLANLGTYAGFLVIQVMWLPIVLALYTAVHRHAIFEGLSFFQLRVWGWLALIFAEDLTFYIFHRTSHGVAVLWASHFSHHTSQHFNLSAAGRQTWTPFLGVVFWLPLAWIGFDPLAILLVQSGSLFFQALLHTQGMGALGPFGWIFNTPSHHRVHHGTNALYFNRNLGGVFIFWDRIFGTFQAESPAVRAIYGTIPQAASLNPIRIGLEGWWNLMRSWRSAPAAVLFTLGLGAALTSGCRSSLLEDYEFRRVYSRLSALKSYEGTLHENGMLQSPSEVISSVRYEAPDHYWIETKSPAPLQGNQLELGGGELWLRYPSAHFAIHWKGLPRLSPEEQENLAHDQFRNFLNQYQWKPLGEGEFQAQAIHPDALIQASHSVQERAHSFPVSGSFNLREGQNYSFRYDPLVFDQPKSGEMKVLPALSFISEWDYQAAAVPINEAEKQAKVDGIRLRMPSSTRPLFKLIRAQAPSVGWAILYQARPYFLTLIEWKDYGLHLPRYGLPVHLGSKGQIEGSLVLGPHLSSLFLQIEGTAYLLIGNLPPEELLAAARQL